MYLRKLRSVVDSSELGKLLFLKEIFIFKEKLSFEIKEGQFLIRMGAVMEITKILVLFVEIKILVIFLH